MKCMAMTKPLQEEHKSLQEEHKTAPRRAQNRSKKSTKKLQEEHGTRNPEMAKNGEVSLVKYQNLINGNLKLRVRSGSDLNGKVGSVRWGVCLAVFATLHTPSQVVAGQEW